MANAKQIALSTKSARDARKGGAAAKKSIKPKPARQGRRAATAPGRKSGRDEAGACHHPAWARHRRDPSIELIAATGWLPHTTRAALTGLRHKGFVLDRGKREDGTTVYRISSAPAVSSPSKAG